MPQNGKRKRSAASTTFPSESTTFHPSKHHKPTPTPASAPSTNPSLSSLKSRQRSLTRALSHKKTSMPADVTIRTERELQSLTLQIQHEEARRERSKMVAKYHMVRFFERQRAKRLLKRMRRRVSDLEGEMIRDDEQVPEDRRRKQQEFEDEVLNCEVDVLYTRFFPLRQAYVSLYPEETRKHGEQATGAAASAGTDGASKEAQGVQPNRTHPLWAMIRSHASQPALLQQLRDGPAVTSSRSFELDRDSFSARNALEARGKMQKRERRAAAQRDGSYLADGSKNISKGKGGAIGNRGGSELRGNETRVIKHRGHGAEARKGRKGAIEANGNDNERSDSDSGDGRGFFESL